MDPSTLKVWKDFVRLGHFMGLVPYKWVTRAQIQSEAEKENGSSPIVTKRWVYDKSIKQKGVFILSYILLGVNQMFLLMRSIQIFSTVGVPAKSKIQVFYLCSLYLTVNIFHWVHLKFYGQHCHIYNAIVETTNHLNKNAKSVRNPNGHLRWMFWFMVFFTYTFGISRGLAVLKYPEMKFHVTSLAPRPKDVSIWLKILAAAFHFHTTVTLTFMASFLPMTSMWYISAMAPIVKQSRLEKSNPKQCGTTTTSSAMQMETGKTQLELYHEYHCLKVVQSRFDGVFRLVPVASELTLLNSAIMNLFLTVVFKDYKSFGKAVGTMTVQFSAIKQMALIDEESSSAVESWKTTGGRAWQTDMDGRNEWFSKFARSCKPVRVSMGGFFFVDRAFILTLLSIIIEQTTNLILSYN